MTIEGHGKVPPNLRDVVCICKWWDDKLQDFNRNSFAEAELIKS